MAKTKVVTRCVVTIMKILLVWGVFFFSEVLSNAVQDKEWLVAVLTTAILVFIMEWYGILHTEYKILMDI